VNNEVVVYPDAADEDTFYVLEPAGGLTGDIVRRAEAVPDPSTVGGQWVVSIDMTGEGSDIWADLTSRLACLRDENPASPKAQVAIVLDGRVESAAGMDPQVACNEGIRGGQTQIDVGSQAEAKQLALVLRTGALPLTLEQSEVQKVSPSLGRDSLAAGIKAGVIGLALVFVYMILYYRALALVVLLGLGLFSAALYTVMALLGESAGLSLSLAGVAGVIVSIGVTADSYIVAFERLKDEVRSGKSVRAAVDRGMVRSFKTILVADFVTGSAAVILFLLAVGPVRGFALTLGIATIMDVLIAYYFTRSAVTLLARSKLFGSGRFIGVREALGAEA
jgi:preprotein translocase subunit SecD